MHLVGAHVETTGGVQNAPQNAHALGCASLAMFTRNQRQWSAPPLAESTVAAFRDSCARLNYGPGTILAHDSYLINLGNPDPAARLKSIDALLDEATRCEQLGIQLLNTHPGSHLGRTSDDECARTIADCINTIHARTSTVTLVLETTAGQGSWIGYRFEHIARVIERVRAPSRVGFCIDTCHIFAAGYDIRTKRGWNEMLQQASTIVGLDKLRGLHLNDSKHALASRKDRHECLGKGHIGLDAFKAIMRDERVAGMPLILETPDMDRWPEEIRMLKSFATGSRTRKS